MEGDLSVLLFLRDHGLAWAYIPGGGKGRTRYGGALDPFVWGHYQLYQSKKHIYIKEIEVIEDFLGLRSSGKALQTALLWTRLLKTYLIEGYPYNDLLILFYWALRALASQVPPDIVHSRFLWRWLQSWGIAPDLRHCVQCGAELGSKALWREGAFCCARCAHDSGAALDLSEFAEYALSRSFIPERNTSGLLEQSRAVQSLFMENLDNNR